MSINAMSVLDEVRRRDERLADLIQRLLVLPARVPEPVCDKLAWAVRMAELRAGMEATEIKRREQFARAKAEAPPKRAEHFRRFVEERLVLGCGEISIVACKQAYYRYCRAHVIPKVEWLTEDEFSRNVAALKGVKKARVFQPDGTSEPGYDGVRIKDQFRVPVTPVSWEVPTMAE